MEEYYSYVRMRSQCISLLLAIQVCPTTFGSTVALVNYCQRKFLIHEKNVTTIHKLYIVVKASDMIVLEESDERSLLSKAKNFEKYSYRFKLLSKTALTVPHEMQCVFSLPIFFSFFFFWLGGDKDYENRKKGRATGKLRSFLASMLIYIHLLKLGMSVS